MRSSEPGHADSRATSSLPSLSLDERAAPVELLQLLVASVREYAIFVLDPEGRIVTWNPGAQRLKQYTGEEIIGRHFSVFYEEDQVRSGHPEWELDVARREGQYEEEGWRVRKDGTRFWASVVITALHDEEGRLPGFAKVTRDLTEKHQETQRLKELEAIKSNFLRLASHELRGPLATLRGYTSMLLEGEIEHPPEARHKVYEIIDNKVRYMRLLVNQMLEAARLEDARLHLSIQRLDLREPVREAGQRGSNPGRVHARGGAGSAGGAGACTGGPAQDRHHRPEPARQCRQVFA